MTCAIDGLMAEHRRILGVLDALERFASSDDATPGTLGQFVAFLVSYADQLHHRKEEDVLFATMVEHGFSREAGPLAVMVHEHDVGRTLTAQLRAASEAPEWTPDLRADMSRAAGELCSLLRNHIAKEDQVLYPMATSRLPEAAMAAVDDRCASADAAAANRGQLEALADELTCASRAGPVAD